MSIDDHLDTQLAEYFGWLEGHLGTKMRSEESAAPRRPRRRLALLLGAAAAVVALVAVGLAVRNDDVPSIGPATSPVINPTLPSTAPTTAGSTNTTATTATTEPTGELTWAPLALPPTMELVDSGTYLDFGLTFTDVSTHSQRFIRFAADGVTIEAQLSLEVRTAGNEIEAAVPNGQVHGLPAVTATPSYADSEVWWEEDGVVVSARAGGLGVDELLGLLNAATLRPVGARGLDPASVGAGLTMLYDADLTMPRVHHTYIVRDMTRNTFVHVHLATPPIGRLFTNARRTPAGVIFETGTVYGWVLVGTDGTVLSIGGIWDTPMDADTAVALASGLQLATTEQLETMRSDIRARLRELPVVGTVTIGARTIELRGGTAAEPEALCMPGTEGPACAFNDIRHDDTEMPIVSRRPLLVDDDWYIVGVGLGLTAAIEGDDEVLRPWHMCSAEADGSLIALLPDERATAYEFEYFLVVVPADVDFVRGCIDVSGELQPNNNGVTVRPLP